MPVVYKLQEGDPVIYTPDPCLYGEMEVRHLHRTKGGKIKRVVCRVDPDRAGTPTYEMFEPEEIEVVGRVE